VFMETSPEQFPLRLFFTPNPTSVFIPLTALDLLAGNLSVKPCASMFDEGPKEAKTSRDGYSPPARGAKRF
jgi:hypothetical protein